MLELPQHPFVKVICLLLTFCFLIENIGGNAPDYMLFLLTGPPEIPAVTLPEISLDLPFGLHLGAYTGETTGTVNGARVASAGTATTATTQAALTASASQIQQTLDHRAMERAEYTASTSTANNTASPATNTSGTSTPAPPAAADRGPLALALSEALTNLQPTVVASLAAVGESSLPAPPDTGVAPTNDNPSPGPGRSGDGGSSAPAGPAAIGAALAAGAVFAVNSSVALAVGVGGYTSFYFSRGASDANATYASFTLSPPTPASANPTTTQTGNVAVATPCRALAGLTGTNTALVENTNATTTGDHCVQTFYSLPVGQALSITTADTNSLMGSLVYSRSASDNATETLKASFYRYDGSSYTLFGTLTSAALAAAPQTNARVSLAANPSANSTFAATDRLVVIVSLNITALSSTAGTTTTVTLDSGPDANLSYVAWGYTLSTPNRPTLLGGYDDDFTTVDTEFGAGGLITSNPSAGTDAFTSVAIGANGYVYAGGYDPVPGNNQWRLEKRDAGGNPVVGFGTNGVVSSNPTSGDDRIEAIAVDASYVYTAGVYQPNSWLGWQVEKRNINTGALVGAFGSSGVVTSDPTATDSDLLPTMTIDSSYIYLGGYELSAGNARWRIEKRDITTGAVVNAFGTNGVITSDPTTNADHLRSLAVDASYIYAAGYDNLGGVNNEWRIEKRDKTTGALVNAFGTNGVVLSNPTGSDDQLLTVSIDASYIYAAGYDTPANGEWRIEKRDITTGAVVNAFGTNGVVLSNPTTGFDAPLAIAATSWGELYIAGMDSTGGQQERIEKRDLTSGALIGTFGTGGVVTSNPSANADWINAIAVRGDGSALFAVGYDGTQGASNEELRIEKHNLVTGALGTACSAGAYFYNGKWACMTQTGNAGDFSSNAVSQDWIWLRNKSQTTPSNFGTTPTNTWMFQVMGSGDGRLQTVVNSGQDISGGSAGIVLWTSSIDFLLLETLYNGTNHIVRTNNSGTPGTASAAVGLYQRVWLRWTKTGTNYQAAYSTDGATWTNIGASGDGGAAIAHGTAFNYTALNVFSPTTGNDYAAAFEYWNNTLGQVAGVTVSPNNSATVNAGTTNCYTHTLTNAGNSSDTFTLSRSDSLSGSGYTSAIYTGVNCTSAGTSFGPIAANAGATVYVLVTVPAGRPGAEVNTTTVTATSGFNGGVTATATETTTTTLAPPTFLLEWGSRGSSDGQFLNATGQAIDSAGNVYVVDLSLRQVSKFSSTGTFLAKWGSEGTGPGQFKSPTFLAIDTANNYVYVSDQERHNVQKFNASGTYLTSWGTVGNGDGQFTQTMGIAADTTGHVYVADLDGRIQKFDSSGTFMTKWWTSGGTIRLATDSAGNIYATNETTSGAGNGVSVYNPSGTLLRQRSWPRPQGIAVDGTGRIYVANFDSGTWSGIVTVFSSDLTTVLVSWGGPGTGPGQFTNVSSLTLNSTGELYTADSQQNRVQKFAALP